MRSIILTGATSGIGLESARLLAKRGFFVVGVGRDRDRCAAAQREIERVRPGAQAAFFTADLSCQGEAVRVAKELAATVADSGGELRALIHNAGGVRGWYTTTEDGYEYQFALNYLAIFLLTHCLLDELMRWHTRVLITGSASHRNARMRWDDVMFARRYRPLAAYAQSKLCGLLFAKGLNDRYADKGIRACVVDPGLVKTEIGSKDAGGLVDLVWPLRKIGGAPCARPAQTFASLCECETPSTDLYVRDGKAEKYSAQVTAENADRLFSLSQKLCGVTYARRPGA